VWKRLRFHNALWHGFVVAGAGLHLAALANCLVFDRL
jgi:hemolysin III